MAEGKCDVERNEWLTGEFEQQRPRLRGIAYRMLGSVAEAEDAVQETWLRLNRADAGAVDNLGGWLTTVVSRICLDMLRSRKSRREEPEEAMTSGDTARAATAMDPEQEAIMADSVGLALLVVLDTLSPAERIAFVLHDLFTIAFDDIASIIQRTPEATRQLASRARRRVRGEPAVSPADLSAQRDIVERFLAALRKGDIEGLVAVLDPDVVVRVDGAAAAGGQAVELRGARTWATSAVAFASLAQKLEVALIDGGVGLVLAPRGRLSRALTVVIAGERIARVDVFADPARLERTQVSAFDR
jgi:RNA polymerase sigma-70 factor (ECF subfamily)